MPPPSSTAETPLPPNLPPNFKGLSEPPEWDAAKCRGGELDFEALRRSRECGVDDAAQEPVPAGLKLVAPPLKTVPYGNTQLVDVVLMNTSGRRVSFTVTVGDGLPSVEFRELKRSAKDVPPGPCVLSMLTSAEFYRFELEPGGKLEFSSAFHPNDALSDSPYMSCTPAPLPRGKGYSVLFTVDINSKPLSSRWAFSIQ